MRREYRSRYTLMESSDQRDELVGDLYPDVLSVGYENFDFAQFPRRVQLTLQYVDKPYTLPLEFYDSYAGDDILMDLNLVPHYEYLETGMIFFMPAARDMERFVKGQSSNERRRI